MDSTIRAYQKILTSWRFEKPSDFPEAFFQERFHKKMEEPCVGNTKLRSEQCWLDWISHDSRLAFPRMPSPCWYKVRHTLHSLLSNFKMGDVSFSSGSEFTPTKGRGSIQQKLSRNWEVTIDSADDFVSAINSCHALRVAVKRKWAERLGPRRSYVDKKLWAHHRDPKKIWDLKVRSCLTLIRGSRFSTVPKNNDKDRPINIEGFGNICVQKRIGSGIRRILLEGYGVDLDTLQDVHRSMVAHKVATIDLKNASDSFSVDMCRFLLPNSFFRLLMRARSGFCLGPDGSFYELNKISSMGNGFTFELMTLILTALVKCLDPCGSVYGDDIIISRSKATECISLLENASLIVNSSKSFTDGPFRESCGSNYHDDFGYIASYDFRYPTDIIDCCVILNKLRLLPYRSSRKLYEALRRATGPALQGPDVETDRLDHYFRTGFTSNRVKPILRSKHLKQLRDLQKSYGYKGEIPLFLTFDSKVSLASRRKKDLRPSDWSKYLMYLHAGRTCDDPIISKRGVSVSVSGLIGHSMVISITRSH